MAASSRIRLLGAFSLGVVVCAAVVAPVVAPVPVYRAWCALAYDGAIPSADGLLLTARPAATGEGGEGPGPWVVLELRNLNRAPLGVYVLDVLGDELGFTASDANGAALASVRPAQATGELPSTQASWLHRTVLAPGAQIGLVCDLSRWIQFPGPGTFDVRAERVAVGSRRSATSISNSIPVRAF